MRRVALCPTPGGQLGHQGTCLENDAHVQEWPGAEWAGQGCPELPSVALGWEGLLPVFHLARAPGWDGERGRSSKNEQHGLSRLPGRTEAWSGL